MLRPSRLLIALLALAFAAVLGPGSAGAARDAQTAGPIFVDTDIGVDDAVAIAWLMAQPNTSIVGFTTVAGNTSNQNAARNLLTLFGAAGRSYPITVGAAAPLELPATRTGALIHGPDGLWFNQAPANISGLPTDAPAALAAAARANPGLTILALGPLTNVAQAVEAYSADMAGVRLIALGGAQRGGNSTPVSEFNIFADPHALDVVLGGGMRVELVTLDAFDQLTVHVTRFPSRLTTRGGPVGQLLGRALGGYFAVQQIANTSEEAGIPDVAAAIYALYPQYGSAQSALVEVSTANDVTRGQTIIGTDLAGRIPIIADDAELSALADQAFTPGFDLNVAIGGILARQPDNAAVILDVDERTMVRLLERSLTR